MFSTGSKSYKLFISDKNYINSEHSIYSLDSYMSNLALEQYLLFIPFYTLQKHLKLISTMKYQKKVLAYNCLTFFLLYIYIYKHILITLPVRNLTLDRVYIGFQHSHKYKQYCSFTLRVVFTVMYILF